MFGINDMKNISLKEKLLLLFCKKQYSIDEDENTYCKITYKKLKDKVYILKDEFYFR